MIDSATYVAQGFSPALKMIDSHCHIAGEEFEADLADVVRRAQDADVTSALVILAAGDAAEATRAEQVRSLWPAVRFATGIHPHQAGTFAGRIDDAMAAVRAGVARHGACAIGEIGLDYHYDFSPRDVQQEIFRAQIRLARETGLPIIIHTREATADTFRVIGEEGAGDIRGVFHCFTGDSDMARAALDIGFCLSFAGILSFPKAASLRDAARLVPADRLLAETDAPYLAPVPYRGKRNEPAYVARVIDVLAETRGETAADVARATDATFRTLFGA
jgi:TatD DNase family protein